MHFLQPERNTPHVHAIYGEGTAAFGIATGEIIEGALPARAAGMVREWIEARSAMECEYGHLASA